MRCLRASTSPNIACAHFQFALSATGKMMLAHAASAQGISAVENMCGDHHVLNHDAVRASACITPSHSYSHSQSRSHSHSPSHSHSHLHVHSRAHSHSDLRGREHHHDAASTTMRSIHTSSIQTSSTHTRSHSRSHSQHSRPRARARSRTLSDELKTKSLCAQIPAACFTHPESRLAGGNESPTP